MVLYFYISPAQPSPAQPSSAQLSSAQLSSAHLSSAQLTEDVVLSQQAVALHQDFATLLREARVHGAGEADVALQL